MASNTLFPPIVEPYQPVFVDVAKVYFTKPNFFNEESYSVECQVLTVDTNSSKNVSSTTVNKEKGYIEITFGNKNNLLLNTYYKVNLRFVVGGATSNWSSPTYIRRISEPKIEKETANLHSISAKFSFASANETETFKYCYVKVDGGEEGEKIPLNGSRGSFEYIFKEMYMGVGTSYNITIHYETSNGYKGSESFERAFNGATVVSKIQNDIYMPHQKIRAFAEPDAGYNSLFLDNKSSNCYIRRASYLTNYTKWETLSACNSNAVKKLTTNYEYDIEIDKETTEKYSYKYYWQDLSAEGGNIYQYQILDVANKKYYMSNKIALDLETNYLMDKDNYLEISFNPTVDSMKYVTTESITNTLGSKYPFIRRNGDVKYKQFNIGGLVSFLTEKENFENISEDSKKPVANSTTTSVVEYEVSSDGYCLSYPKAKPITFTKTDLFKTAETDYKSYKTLRGISNYKDFILERVYRDAVIEFLMNGQPKLFKSAPEGNMIVQLTNISFKPENGLGRMIYSFSATATEMADPIHTNYIKFNLIKED